MLVLIVIVVVGLAEVIVTGWMMLDLRFKCVYLRLFGCLFVLIYVWVVDYGFIVYELRWVNLLVVDVSLTL